MRIFLSLLKLFVKLLPSYLQKQGEKYYDFFFLYTYIVSVFQFTKSRLENQCTIITLQIQQVHFQKDEKSRREKNSEEGSEMKNVGDVRSSSQQERGFRFQEQETGYQL